MKINRGNREALSNLVPRFIITRVEMRVRGKKFAKYRFDSIRFLSFVVHGLNDDNAEESRFFRHNTKQYHGETTRTNGVATRLERVSKRDYTRK